MGSRSDQPKADIVRRYDISLMPAGGPQLRRSFNQTSRIRQRRAHLHRSADGGL
jgi:hypothetical protein